MIEILSMQGCVPCGRLKAALAHLNVEYTDYDAKVRGNERATELKKVASANKITTVPVVFLDGEFIGDSQTSLLPIIETLYKEV